VTLRARFLRAQFLRALGATARLTADDYLERGRIELRRGQTLTGVAALPPLNRAIAAFESAIAAGGGADGGTEATTRLAAALLAKAHRTGGEGARYLRARAVAMIEARIATLDAARHRDERQSLLTALASAWMPMPDEDPGSSDVYRLWSRACEAQSRAIAACDRTNAPQIWARSVMLLAEMQWTMADHPDCADVAAQRRLVRDTVRDARSALSLPDDGAGIGQAEWLAQTMQSQLADPNAEVLPAPIYRASDFRSAR